VEEEGVTDDQFFAWVAGLFEGEGTVRINSFTKQNLGALIVSVCNCDMDLLTPLLRWGGRIHKVNGLGPTRRPAWRWTCAAKQAAAFLVDVSPYFVATRNKERARAGLLFQAGKRHRHHQPPNYREEQWNAFMWMKELNQRGVQPQ
jgi:hypothetical protein